MAQPTHTKELIRSLEKILDLCLKTTKRLSTVLEVSQGRPTDDVSHEQSSDEKGSTGQIGDAQYM